jgi:hypothetical protein
MQRDAMAGRGGTLRGLALLVCFGAVLAAVLAGGISWLRDARLGRPTLVFDYSRITGNRLPALAQAGRAGQTTVAVLGDSALVSYPDGRTVPDRLQERLPFHVASLGVPGSGPFEYYFLASEIAGADPDLVVIGVNLDHFSHAWQGAYSRPQLAGLIGAERLGEALMLPLHWTGLTTDRLLFYIGLVEAGGYEPWYWLTLRQAQMGRARQQLEAWLQGSGYVARNDTGDDTPERLFRQAVDRRTIERVFTGPDIHRYREDALREHYAVTLAGIPNDHPVLRVLAATVAGFRDRDVDVLVYAVPLDVEYLAEQGLLDRDGLDRTVSTLANAVIRNGGIFADLHALFETEVFRDAPGHLVFEGDIDGPALLAEALAPSITKILAGSRRQENER